MLEVKNVSKQYRGEDKLLFDAVSDVSLSMEEITASMLWWEKAAAEKAPCHG